MPALFLVFACLISFKLYSDSFFEQAKTFYTQALAAQNYLERQEAFNRALFLLHESEAKEEAPASFEVYAALGDVYFQLNALPWAELYYERALRDRIADRETVVSRLHAVQQKLWIPLSHPKPLVYRLSLELSKQKESMALLFVLALLCGGLSFLSFFHSPSDNLCSKKWQNWMRGGLKIHAFIFASLFFLLVFNAFFFYLVSPIEAILVRPTAFYRFAKISDALVDPTPLFAGLKVQILEITEDKKWIKIKEGDRVGYIKTKTCRLI